MFAKTARSSRTAAQEPGRHRRPSVASFGGTVLAAVLWGTVGPLVTLYPAGAGIGFAFVRLVVGAPLLLLLAARKAATVRWTARDRGVALVGGVGVAAYQPLYFSAISRTGVAVATFLAIGVAPVVTGLTRWILSRHRPSWRWWLATAIACCGVGFLSLGGGQLTLSVVGVLVAVTAGVCYSLQATTLGALSPRHGSPCSVAAIFLVGAAMMLPVLYGQNLAWLGRPGLMLGALYAGVATLGLAYALFAHGVSVLGSATAVTISLLEPLTAALLGVLVLGEKLTAPMVVGFVLILGGLVLAVRDVGRTQATPSAPT